MKRILTTLKEKWPEYLLEILVITIGILGAFGLSNWNENKRSAKQKRELLINLRADFQSDTAQISALKRLGTQRRNYARYLLKHLERFPQKVDSGEVVIALERVSYMHDFNPSMASYQQMIESGLFDLISSDELMNALNYYDSRVRSTQKLEEANAIYIRSIVPLLLKYMDEGHLGGIHAEIPEEYHLLSFDLEKMSRDQELIALLKFVYNKSNSEVRYRDRIVKPIAIRILQLIDNELAK